MGLIITQDMAFAILKKERNLMSQCCFCNESSSIIHCWCFHQESKFHRNSSFILPTFLVHWWKEIHQHSLWNVSFLSEFAHDKTKVCFLFHYTGNSVQTRGKGWQMALDSQNQHLKSRSRPWSLSAHINRVRVQKESVTTQKVKIAAHTLLCIPFKLVITLR